MACGIGFGAVNTTPFVSTWVTSNAGTSSSTQIKFPTNSIGPYNCVVDWGDSTTSSITAYNSASWTHTYSSSGTYTVKIYGTYTGIVFNNGGDKLKLTNISQFGHDFRVGTTQGLYFYGCSNLTITAKDTLNCSGMSTCINMFNGCSSLTSIPSLNNFNTASVTSMNSMFNFCTNFNQSSISLNTSNVTDISSFIDGCHAFNGTFNINTQNVTTMQAMLTNCIIFNQPVNFNTANVTSMASMFDGCADFNQTVSFNTSKVTSMTNMFLGTTAFNQDISAFNIGSLTAASNMFLNSGFNITNYNLLLNNTTGWPSQATIKSSVTFSAGTAHYSSGAPTTGRAILTGTYSWTITDGGSP